MALKLNKTSSLRSMCNDKQTKLNGQSNGLETAFVLPAITLTSQCYKQMFSGFQK